jgi:peptidoglycan/LPS O-acetylase OafA/YrhL
VFRLGSSAVRPRRPPSKRPPRVPDPGQYVNLHTEDGSWRKGFRALSEPWTAETGEVVTWVATEDEYRAAGREGRSAIGVPWPTERMVVCCGVMPRRGLRAPGTAERGGRTITEGGARLPYMPGLDGLRALAVAAVLLYHAGLAWIPGGFLGVDVFFVLSGYLITSLLLAEWRTRGRVDLKAFWFGRARRLLPAAFLVIAVTLAFAVAFLPGEVAGLRSDALASFGYVTNWYLIFEHESYFEAVGRPSLLRHLWSLAVEEQFYVLWPPLLAVGLGTGALRYRGRRLLSAVLVGAAASALLMAVLYRPETDPSRVYYGTDTRAAGLLVGAALAFLWAPWRAPGQVEGPEEPGRPAAARHRRTRRPGRFRRRWGWTVPALLDALGLAALGGLVWSCLRFGEHQPSLYRGGFVLVAITTAALIAAVVHPRARLGAGLLGRQPLRWIGERSYGIYLWHWPVFMITRPRLDVPLDGLPLLLARLVVTVALAHLSYRYVETPIRRGALGRAWGALRQARGARRWRLGARWAGAAVPVLAASLALGLVVAHAKPPEAPSSLSTRKVHIEASDPTSGPNKAAEKAAANAAASVTMPESATDPSAEAPTGTVTAVGDSVMLGAVGPLQREIPNLAVIDARGSRQPPEAIAVLRQLRAAGKLGNVVVVHIGNNGPFTAEQFDEMMGVLSGAREVLVVNTTVPDGYSWAPNNEVLADGVRRYPNRAVLVDWHAASAGHPGFFWDGLHLTPRGARAYADLIAALRLL